MYKEDTIAAVATPVGEGGVAIIRISGPEAERIAKDIFFRNGGKNGHFRSHTLHYGSIRNPKSGAALDEVLLTLMRKPRSYTGEDVVEVHCHGGPFLARQILELILSCGARHAEPGEYTKRAFLNGRMDLAQAEAVLDLIQTRTEKGMRLALEQMHGALSRWVGELREELIDILVQVEAAIDFPEEDIELLQRQALTEKVDGLREKISYLISTYEWGRLYREGAKVCIVGRPNVGKSSLLNALLGKQRVIVTPVPGTTRDVIEEGLNLGGLPMVLWDTAGIRETNDQVERIGVEFSKKHLEEADAALTVLDGSLMLTDEDRHVLGVTKNKKGIIVVNKSDLPQRIGSEAVKIVDGKRTVHPVSAKRGDGIEELKFSLQKVLVGIQKEPEIAVTNIRHRASLELAEEGLRKATKALAENMPPEIVAVDLQEAKEGLEEIVGVVTNDNILERIFSNFCIGK